MKSRLWWIVTAVISATPMQAQVEVAPTSTEQEKAGFFVDAISFSGTDKTSSRLDVFVQAAYEDLSFVKVGDNYEASYDVTIVISDKNNRLVREKHWREVIKPVTFEQSVSASAYSITQRIFDLAPGTYILSIMLQDNETRVLRRVVRQITIPDYGFTGFSLSDIMLVSRIIEAGEKKTITPLVSGNVGTLAGPFYTFFESYADSVVPDANLRIVVSDDKKQEKLRIDTLLTFPAGRNAFVIPIDATSLSVGDYSLYFLVRNGPGEEAEVISSTSRKFVIRWPGLPKTVKDIDTAVDHIVYIADAEEMEYVKGGSDAQEKQRRLMEFWKKKDPNPNTPRNEKMEQYYNRVEYANKNFSHYIEGWRTDMGMVFIIFGSPNSVDRHPFDMGSKPFEVWTYYNLNYSFIFIDESGFGDYHLQTPIWEVLQRPRN